MRKMIDSGVEWLGAIPQDWDLVQIKSIASCKSEKSSYIGGAYIGLEHIESGSGKLLADGSQTGIEVDSTVSSFSDTDMENCAPILRRLQSLISTDNAPPKFLC